MTVVLEPNLSHPTTFEPTELKKPQTDDLLDIASKRVAKQTEENLGLLICELQKNVEAQNDAKIQEALKRTEAIKQKLAQTNELIEKIDEALSNASAKTISLADHSALVANVKTFINDPALEKTEWKRSEAEALSRMFSRHSQQFMNAAEEESRSMSWLLSDKHEFLTSFRDVMKVFIDMMALIVRNQRT